MALEYTYHAIALNNQSLSAFLFDPNNQASFDPTDGSLRLPDITTNVVDKVRHKNSPCFGLNIVKNHIVCRGGGSSFIFPEYYIDSQSKVHAINIKRNNHYFKKAFGIFAIVGACVMLAFLNTLSLGALEIAVYFGAASLISAGLLAIPNYSNWINKYLLPLPVLTSLASGIALFITALIASTPAGWAFGAALVVWSIYKVWEAYSVHTLAKQEEVIIKQKLPHMNSHEPPLLSLHYTIGLLEPQPSEIANILQNHEEEPPASHLASTNTNMSGRDSGSTATPVVSSTNPGHGRSGTFTRDRTGAMSSGGSTTGPQPAHLPPPTATAEATWSSYYSAS